MSFDRGRVPLPGARRLEVVDEDVSVTVYFRSRSGAQPSDEARVLARRPLRSRLRETRRLAEIVQDYGADPVAVEHFRVQAEGAGLEVGPLRAASRSLRVRGPAAAVAAFFVAGDVALYGRGEERYRGRVGALGLPDDLARSLDAVLGLDDRRVAAPDVYRSASERLSADAGGAGVQPGPDVIRSHVIRSHVIPSHVIPSHVIPSHTGRADQPAAGPGFTPSELAELYEFPPGTTGRGQRIGIIALNRGRGPEGRELVGGYSRVQLHRAFGGSEHGVPHIIDVPVDPELDRNEPGDGTASHDVTAEVLLDLQVAAGLAPEAEFVIYFSESSERGLTDAVWRAVTDQHDLTVLLICYGSPEGAEDGALWTGMCLDELDRALATAALRGITVVTSCGDNGGAGAPWTTRVHADFPAASPWVLSCGGTRVDRFVREPEGLPVRLETVWNDGRAATGGGISRLVPRPPWQSSADLPGSADWAGYPGRGVPDVAALADPATGVRTYDGTGALVLSGGTSVAAPIWAALVARLAEALSEDLGGGARLGLLAPALYELIGTDCFTDVMLGDNGPYRARRGWDPCTGLGTPRGTRLLAALR